jgi:hypothetical protein
MNLNTSHKPVSPLKIRLDNMQIRLLQKTLPLYVCAYAVWTINCSPFPLRVYTQAYLLTLLINLSTTMSLLFKINDHFVFKQFSFFVSLFSLYSCIIYLQPLSIRNFNNGIKLLIRLIILTVL